MDSRHVLVRRSLTARSSRRTTLTALVAAAIAGLLNQSGTAGAPRDKTKICHWTASETNEFVVIKVADDALAAHLAHGDALYQDGECVVEPTCDVVENPECAPPGND